MTTKAEKAKGTLAAKAEKAKATKMARHEKLRAQASAAQAQMVEEIRQVLAQRVEALTAVGAEDHDIAGVKIAHELLITAGFISAVSFGPHGSDPGLIIATYDRIVAQSEFRAKLLKPYG